MISMISAFAQFERDVLVEPTRSGMEAARRRGARIGRPRVMFDLDAAREQIAAGETIASAARAHQIGATTLRRALASRPMDATA